ncbi:MAG TPA: peptide deformylase [Terriglobales bacterium]|jgi:peptide deformylase|nr:peptide deformylase [Terriglobales bacterium]
MTMLLKLLQVGEPVLRDRARPLSSEEILSGPIQELISSMHDTLRDAPGVGLAAPQVGVPIQLAIIEDPPEYWTELSASDLAARERTAVPFHVIINPRITSASEPSIEFFEGCLSLDGFTALVPRSREVTVECLDERAEPKTIRASGWYARILQHEIDHLNGTIYIDRMLSRTFMSLDNYKRFWKSEKIEEVRKRFAE